MRTGHGGRDPWRYDCAPDWTAKNFPLEAARLWLEAKSFMIRQAGILCAASGHKLRPFTDQAPKPMLPLLGVPMVEWNIRRFRQFGVTDFFINLHYLQEVLRDYLGDGSRLGVRLHYHLEPELLGTAGGINKCFEDLLNDEFFLIYGDIFSNVAPAQWRGHGVRDQAHWACENHDTSGRLRRRRCRGVGRRGTRRRGSPEASHFNLSECLPHARSFVLRREILNHVPTGTYSEIGRDLTGRGCERQSFLDTSVVTIPRASIRSRSGKR